MLLVVMATRNRYSSFPYIDIVRQQQLDLNLPGLMKVSRLIRARQVSAATGLRAHDVGPSEIQIVSA